MSAPARDTVALPRRIYDRSHLTGEFTLRSGATSDEYFDKYLVRARIEAEPGGTPSSRRGAPAPRRKPAPRGQTQAKVLASLAAAPGSSAAAIAKASGISPNVAAATISRLVKQGRVRRLDDGGYVVEAAGSGAQSSEQPPSPGAA